MNVRIKITRKEAKCYYCNKLIEYGEFQVVCTYFMPLKHSERVWTKQMRFHAENPNCWLERAKVELRSRPKPVETRGRKAAVISDENRVKRMKILRRRASVVQRINREMETLRRPAKMIHLVEMLEKLKVEIKLVGGVPESWESK